MPRGSPKLIEREVLRWYDFAYNSVQNGLVREDPLYISPLPDANHDLRRHIEYLKKQPKPVRPGRYRRFVKTPTGELMPLVLYIRQQQESMPPLTLQQAQRNLWFFKQCEEKWAAEHLPGNRWSTLGGELQGSQCGTKRVCVFCIYESHCGVLQPSGKSATCMPWRGAEHLGMCMPVSLAHSQ